MIIYSQEQSFLIFFHKISFILIFISSKIENMLGSENMAYQKTFYEFENAEKMRFYYLRVDFQVIMYQIILLSIIIMQLIEILSAQFIWSFLACWSWHYYCQTTHPSFTPQFIPQYSYKQNYSCSFPFLTFFIQSQMISDSIYFPQQRMFRAIPVSNKLCFDKEIKRSWKIHESKLSCLKGSVGKQRPQRFEFLDQRPKKIALQEVRNIEVDRENQALLKKIKTIQSKGCKTSYARLYEESADSRKKTLNEPYRKRELLKIIGENQDILKRLQQKRSEYSIKKMERERQKIEKNISLISEFPYKHFPNSHTPVNMWATTDNLFTHTAPPSELAFTFKGEREIDGFHYLIVSYLTKGNFYLQMEGVEDRRDKYRIELPEQKARDLLRVSYNGKIEQLVSHLSIDREKQVCFLRYSPG